MGVGPGPLFWGHNSIQSTPVGVLSGRCLHPQMPLPPPHLQASLAHPRPDPNPPFRTVFGVFLHGFPPGKTPVHLAATAQHPRLVQAWAVTADCEPWEADDWVASESITALEFSCSEERHFPGSQFSQKRLLKQQPESSSQKPHLTPEAFPLAKLTGKEKKCTR